MAAITWAMVTGYTGDFSSVPGPSDPFDVQGLILSVVNDYFDVSLFGGEDSAQLKHMRILLAAHMATGLPAASGGSGGSAGAIVSESGGDGLSVTYASGALVTAADQWSTSEYGRQLSQYVRESPARAGVIL